MNRKWIFVALGASGTLALAATLWWQFGNDVRSTDTSEEGVADATPSLAKRIKSLTGSRKAPPDVAALLADDSPLAWSKVVERYPSADDDTKREILHKATSRKNLKQALTQVLQTVGNDERPVAEDPMVNEVAAMLKSRWQSSADLELGRHMMLLQDTDKKRWTLGKALVTAVKELSPSSPLHAQKNRLKAKLVDLHADTTNDVVKAEIVESLHDLGGRDAALILAKGSDVGDTELEGVQEQQRAVDGVLGDAR